MSSLIDLVGFVGKLVTEHGSADVLEKHLGLVKYEAAQLERKVNLLESQMIILRQENEKQAADNAALQQENLALKERIKDLEKPKKGMIQMEIGRR